MPSIFTPVQGRGRGYDTAQVDDFFARAKESYDHGTGQVTAQDVRSASFDMVKHGYDPEQVDAALERLEDAFAERDREVALQRMSASDWRRHAQEQAIVIVNRLLRPDGRKFNRSGLFGVGYNRQQVDSFAYRIVDHFRNGAALEVPEVRGVLFARQSNGYEEKQVDALLDRTVETMQAVSESGGRVRAS